MESPYDGLVFRRSGVGHKACDTVVGRHIAFKAQGSTRIPLSAINAQETSGTRTETAPDSALMTLPGMNVAPVTIHHKERETGDVGEVGHHEAKAEAGGYSPPHVALSVVQPPQLCVRIYDSRHGAAPVGRHLRCPKTPNGAPSQSRHSTLPVYSPVAGSPNSARSMTISTSVPLRNGRVV
ncbi:hypothetical protein VTK56DRAFT_4433 [Thermocarpiscus australiensis]